MGDSSFGGGGHAASDLMEGNQYEQLNFIIDGRETATPSSVVATSVTLSSLTVTRCGQLSDWLSANGKLQCLLPMKLCS